MTPKNDKMNRDAEIAQQFLKQDHEHAEKRQAGVERR